MDALAAAPKSIAEAGRLYPAARAALRSRPKIVSEPRSWNAVSPDFSLLPVQTCWPGDAGPLITWPIVITRPPGNDDASAYNLGVYRMQVLDKDAAIVRWLPMRGGAGHHRLWAERGLDMPMAVVIGADPATILAAVMPAPEGVSELVLAGLLGGRRPELTPCRTIPIHVPASAEIVLEGTVSPPKPRSKARSATTRAIITRRSLSPSSGSRRCESASRAFISPHLRAAPR